MITHPLPAGRSGGASRGYGGGRGKEKYLLYPALSQLAPGQRARNTRSKVLTAGL